MNLPNRCLAVYVNAYRSSFDVIKPKGSEQIQKSIFRYYTSKNLTSRTINCKQRVYLFTIRFNYCCIKLKPKKCLHFHQICSVSLYFALIELSFLLVNMTIFSTISEFLLDSYKSLDIFKGNVRSRIPFSCVNSLIKQQKNITCKRHSSRSKVGGLA